MQAANRAFEYGLDDKVPFLRSVVIGLQWAAVIVSSVIILGNIVVGIHFVDPLLQIMYLQKILFLCALTLLLQIFLGHRLPLVPGPAAVLFIGVLSSQSSGMSAIYSSVMLGGAFIAGLAVTGLFRHLQPFFTANVVAVVLLLIAFTIAPTIQQLIIDKESGISPLFNMGFGTLLLFLLFFVYRFLSGVWRSTLIVWAMIAGSLSYDILFRPGPSARFLDFGVPWFGGLFQEMTLDISVQPGVLISFLFCFIALSINDLGSIQSLNEMLHLQDGERRITRGIFITGLANAASGFFGVIGPVNYTVSPGLIVATGCASRFTLVPTAVILLILAFMPAAVGVIASVPPVVIGAVMAYVMAAQIGAGLMVAFKDTDKGGFRFENGLVIGSAILLGAMVAFLPDSVIETLPPFLRPILGNGFVVGVLSAFVLEQFLAKRGHANQKASSG